MNNKNHNSHQRDLLIKAKCVITIIQIFASCFFVYLGYKLFILGATGEIDLAINTEFLSVRSANASPGAILVLIGLISFYVVSVKNLVKFNDTEKEEIKSTTSKIPSTNKSYKDKETTKKSVSETSGFIPEVTVKNPYSDTNVTTTEETIKISETQTQGICSGVITTKGR